MNSYLSFQLALPHAVSYFFFLFQSPSSLCTVFDCISSNIDEVLLINPSANLFVVGDFNLHYKDWLACSGGTDRPGKLCYDFSIWKEFTQMVKFPTHIPNCDSYSPALLDLFLFSDTCICSTMAFPSLENSDHVDSVVIYFLSNSQRDTLFHCTAYDYFHADWDHIQYHLRHVP